MMPIHSSPTQPASPASDQSAAHDLPPLEEEPRLQYGASRKLNRKAILFLAALGVMGMGLLAWGFSQFSLFGKREPAKAATERVVIPDDPPMPPVPVAPASAALTGAAGGMSPRGQETAPLPETPQPGQAIALAAPGGSAAPAQGGRARGAGQGAVAPWAAQAGNPGTAAHGEGDALSRQRAGSSGLVMNAASPADDRNAFQVARGSVRRLAHADYLLTRGTYIRCVLETRIVTDISGYASCVVTEPVYSTTGRHVLIPRGSKISGQYKLDGVETGRVGAVWERVLTPNGLDVALGSPGVDGLGGAGHPGHVDRHWGSRLTGALLVSMMGDLVQIESNRFVSDSAKTTTTLSGVNGTAVQQVNPYQTQTAATLQQFAQNAVTQTANRRATVTINQGTLINIYASRDIDFSAVMQ